MKKYSEIGRLVTIGPSRKAEIASTIISAGKILTNLAQTNSTRELLLQKLFATKKPDAQKNTNTAKVPKEKPKWFFSGSPAPSPALSVYA
ncbi:hypothetical protein D3C78_1455050 [compost metagenome]